MVVIAQRGVGGMEMKKDIRKQPGKVGNSEEVEEAAIMMMKTIIKHLRVAVAETHVVVKAEAGMGMKKNIHKEGWKVDNVVAVEAVITMKTIRTIKGLHAVGVVVVAVTMTTKTITNHRHAAAAILVVVKAEVGMEMKKDTPKQRWKAGKTAVEAEAVTMNMMTIIKGLHEVGVAEIQEVEMAEVGMVMKKDIRKRLWKVGSIVVAEEAAEVKMMMTIIKDLHAVVVAQVHGAEMAEVGMGTKKNIPGQRGKAGETGTDHLKTKMQIKKYTRQIA